MSVVMVSVNVACLCVTWHACFAACCMLVMLLVLRSRSVMHASLTLLNKAKYYACCMSLKLSL